VDAGTLPTLTILDQSAASLANGRIVLALNLSRAQLAANGTTEVSLSYAWSIATAASENVGPELGARGLIYHPRTVPNSAGALTRQYALTDRRVLDVADPAPQS
jgi:hypothetical protein